MPISCQCFCGARYTVPDEHAGRTVKCSKCGHLISIPEIHSGQSQPLPLAEQPETSPEAQKPYAQLEQEIIQSNRRKAPKGMSQPPQVIIEKHSGFWRDTGRAFVLFSSFEVTLTLLFIWFISMLASACLASGFCILIAFALLCYGYVYAYYMNCIIYAASGEEGLPPATIWNSVWEDMVIPMVQWWGCLLFVHIPAIGAAFVFGLIDVEAQIVVVVIVIMAAIGWFFWPIAILTIALGGLSMLPRFDMAVRSIFKSPGPYFLICLLILIAVVPSQIASYYLELNRPDTLKEFFSVQYLVVRILVGGLSTYCMLVCTRLVGLYYHHFKDDFPWAMG